MRSERKLKIQRNRILELEQRVEELTKENEALLNHLEENKILILSKEDKLRAQIEETEKVREYYNQNIEKCKDLEKKYKEEIHIFNEAKKEYEKQIKKLINRLRKQK